MTSRHALDQIGELSSLEDGWDGERATKPSAEAIQSAIDFVCGDAASSFEISPHVDGSIIIESEAGDSLFRILQDGKICRTSISNHGSGN